MQISYFEEFSTKNNLNKLKLIKNHTKLYLAASSLEEFSATSKRLDRSKLKEVVYWPILSKKEGYWISPFSRRSALKRIFLELKDQTLAVMLDLELPTTKNPWLYFTQFVNFFRNKHLISNFIEKYAGQIYLAEYYPEGEKKERIMGLLGIHYKNIKVKVIKMFYHSLHDFNVGFMNRELKRGVEEFGDNYLIAFGTIARGISGNEPLLKPEQLRQDLELAEKAGVKEVIIFRLGGLNKKYFKVLEIFS